MVSLRCKMMVKSELEKLDIPYTYIELGEVLLPKPISSSQRHQLTDVLRLSGLELMVDKKAILIEKIKNIIVEMVHYADIEKIKNIIVEMVHYADELPEVNFSVFISEKLQRDYHTLSELFSKTTGMTIEHFIIIHKIEKAKELIMYDELNLTEISYKLHYSSVAHLSHQFKKVTGLTPSFFKKMQKRKRSNIEDL